MTWLLFLITTMTCLFSGETTCSAETLTQAALKSLPDHSKSGVIPRLEIEWPSTSRDQFFLLVTFEAWNRVTLFNPFGDASLGSPFRFIITDSNWTPIHDAAIPVLARDSIPSQDAWIDVHEGRIIGRRFKWLLPPVLSSSECGDEFRWPTLKRGVYLIHLVVSSRMTTDAPFDGIAGNAVAQARWREAELDRALCRSNVVKIEVDDNGSVVRPSSIESGSHSPIRVTASLHKSSINVRSVLVVDRQRRMVDPGFRNLPPSCGISIATPESRLHQIVEYGESGSSYVPTPKDYRTVPGNALLGFCRRYRGEFESGEYEVSVRYPDSIWYGEEADTKMLRTKVVVRLDAKDVVE